MLLPLKPSLVSLSKHVVANAPFSAFHRCSERCAGVPQAASLTRLEWNERGIIGEQHEAPLLLASAHCSEVIQALLMQTVPTARDVESLQIKDL